MSERRRMMMGAEELPAGAYAYYPFNGDTLDYSGNGRNIVTKRGFNVYSDHILASSRTDYLMCPFYIGDCHPKTVSITIDYNKNSVVNYDNVFLAHITNNESYWFGLVMYSKSNASNMDGMFYGGYDFYNGYFRGWLLPNGKINLTFVTSGNAIKMYLNGDLLYEKNYPQIYKPNTYLYIGNRQLKDRAYMQNIYGFALYDRILTDEEIKQLSKMLK